MLQGMASTFVIADLLTDAAKLANVPPFSATTNVTSTTASYWLVQAGRSLTARMRAAFGDDADHVRSADLNVPVGLGYVSLPENTGEVHTVLWAKSASEYILLAQSQLEDMEQFLSSTTQNWRDCPTPTYRLEGETLAFDPPSSSIEVVTLFYTGHSDLTGQVNMIARLDGDRWVTLDVAIRVMQAQGRDASVLVQDKLMLEAQLFSPSRRRRPKGIARIRDTRGAANRRGSW